MRFNLNMVHFLEGICLNLIAVSSCRVGREDAKTRQDIVLSGHFIRDEHCTFSSTTGPQGEGKWLAALYALICKIKIFQYSKYIEIQLLFSFF